MKDRIIDSRERLVHIQEAISNIEVFVNDIGKDEFTNDQLVSSAVLFQFSSIGEAITRIDAELLGKYQYPWHKVRSFRYLISHIRMGCLQHIGFFPRKLSSKHNQ